MEIAPPQHYGLETTVIQGWLYDIQQSVTAPLTSSKRKASTSPRRHTSSHTPSQGYLLRPPRLARPPTSPTTRNSMSGRNRGAQRTARPADAQLHADEDDAPAVMPDTSSEGGRSQYLARLRLHNSTFGATRVPSFSSVASSTSASGQRSPKRRRSPTKAAKTPADLHMADIPVVSSPFTSLDQVPASLHGLVQAMKRIHQGAETIPMPVADQVTASLGPTDPDIEDSWLVDSNKYPVHDESILKVELEQLTEVAATSEECRQEGAHEVVWNEEVHSRLLKTALLPFRGCLRYRNVTAVDILPEYLPAVGNSSLTLSEAAVTNTSSATPQTTTLQTKRVDYVIVLDDEEVRTASLDLLRRQLGTPLAAESINHVVDNTFLRYRPITVSIETKTPEGSELQGRTQLGIWATAHAMRLRAATRDEPTELAFPLVFVVGSRWTVHFLVDKGTSLHIYEVLTSEDSATIVGCYRVIALIRELGRWSTNVYRPWFRQAILAVSEN